MGESNAAHIAPTSRGKQRFLPEDRVSAKTGASSPLVLAIKFLSPGRSPLPKNLKVLILGRLRSSK